MNHTLNNHNDLDEINEHLFSKIAADIKTAGYSINPVALPIALGNHLTEYLNNISRGDFHSAGVGRDKPASQNNTFRGDDIYWITVQFAAGQEWLQWIACLQQYINRHLFLGLFSFESHFAHYKVGDFYKRHRDAFKGEHNRVLSIVVYLNTNWLKEDGGELVLYRNDADSEGIKVIPSFGTVAVFLSEEYPHEVLPALRDRYSIAGWFRVNSSTKIRVDLPL
jgi:SM-20-related protein